VDYLRREIQLAPDEVYSYETFTTPPFRGMHIASMALAFKMRYFRALGYCRLIGVVVTPNRRALEIFQKIGYRSCGTMGYVRLGPWRRDFAHFAARRAPNPPDWNKTLVWF
jgi:L-amino acid N-acyltransferase YncA